MTRLKDGSWAAEPLALVALVVSYIWGWKNAFPQARVVVVVGYFLIGFVAHLRRGESARAIGLGLDNAGRAVRLVVSVFGLPAVAVLSVGIAAGWWHPPLRPAAAVVWHLLWGTAQEYGLLAVIFRGLVRLWPEGWRAEVATGFLFALCHLPNPFLVPVTAGAGAVGARVYRRAPNLPVLGATHAVLGMVLGHALPENVTLGMRVGPAVFAALAGG